jgi:terminal uridylyltransferase
VQDLENHLQRRYPTVSLDLFGSSCNGFGFRKSDLDICLTFTDNPTGEVITTNAYNL